MSRIFELLQRLEQQNETEQEGLIQPPKDPYASWTATDGSPSSSGPKASALQFGSAARDAVGKLVQQLFFVEHPPRVVVFSALERKAGCTFLAARTAEILAEQCNGSVCLVDGNIRCPALHAIFKIDNGRGLRDVIERSDPSRSCAKRLPDRNLWVLTSGQTCNGEYVIQSNTIRNWIRQIRTEFTYIVVDSPPLTLCNDTLGLAASSEGIVLVLKANSSRRETAQNTLQDLRRANIRLLGAILNQRTFPVPEAIYKRL